MLPVESEGTEKVSLKKGVEIIISAPFLVS
jgi:hypothetical protein